MLQSYCQCMIHMVDCAELTDAPKAANLPYHHLPSIGFSTQQIRAFTQTHGNGHAPFTDHLMYIALKNGKSFNLTG